MSQLVARILLTIFMLPLAVIVFGVAASFSESRGGESKMFIIAGLAMWIFVAFYWLMLWRKQIKWTPERMYGTPGLAILAIVVGCIVAALFSGIDRELGTFMGSIVTPLVWLMGTVLLWRETKSERVARLQGTSTDVVICASCGYNLTGLSEARCPECGTKFTLNELFSRQPQREAAKLDQEIAG